MESKELEAHLADFATYVINNADKPYRNSEICELAHKRAMEILPKKLNHGYVNNVVGGNNGS